MAQIFSTQFTSITSGDLEMELENLMSTNDNAELKEQTLNEESSQKQKNSL